MKSILILGAGRSSPALISYLQDFSARGNCNLTVADVSVTAAQERISNSVGTALAFDIANVEKSREVISNADVVISLLPPHFHATAAQLCLKEGKHLLTASYVSDEMKALDKEAGSKSLLFLNECGLDPGIDHMSAMKVIDGVRTAGGRLISFESFTGGLIAPETEPDNPWRYKFTWNSRNVVMAGQGTAKFLQDRAFKYIPYQQLFSRTTSVEVPGFGKFEGYANRDSLKYRTDYRLENIETMLRGTLRHEGFCAAWNILVQLGCCDDGYELENVGELTHTGFMSLFLEGGKGLAPAAKIARTFSLREDGPELQKLQWSGLFEEEKIGLTQGTPARVLEHILNKKWKLRPSDKDMVVMWHRFRYEQNGSRKEIQSSLVVKGTDALHTAMAKTVGLPLGIAAKLLIEGKIKKRGVVIPVDPELYEPILDELKHAGIELTERHTDY